MRIEPIIVKEPIKTSKLQPKKKTKKKPTMTPDMKEYEQVTGKNAIWQGEVTKQFEEWVAEGKPKPEKKPEKKEPVKKRVVIKKEVVKPDLDFTQPMPKKEDKKDEFVMIKKQPEKKKITKQPTLKKEEPINQDITEPTAEEKALMKELEGKSLEEISDSPESKKIKKEQADWGQGPKPSKKAPPKPQYAFEPTPQELEMMKDMESEEREKEVLKPTPEEEQMMEQMRDPDLIKEFEPTPEELGYMQKEGIVKEPVDLSNRTMTGIEGIDELTHGGLPKKRAVAVVGGPGTGKSIMLMQFLVNGARDYGEPGIYITFEEDVKELKSNYKSFNFGIEELEKKGLLKIVHYSPMKIKRFIRNMDVTLRELIRDMKAKRIVIDSLSAFTLLFSDEGAQREGLFQLFQTLKGLDTTTLLSTESWREPTITKSGVIEFIADGVIMLYNLKIGDTRVRAIEVLKMRSIEHENRIVPFRITNEGIKIFTEEEVFGGQGRTDTPF